MSQYRKRIDNLMQKKEQRLKTAVVIADIIKRGEYVYKGNIYSEAQFGALMKKVNPNVIILDDTKIADISNQK